MFEVIKVDNIPDCLEYSTIYISEKYSGSSHMCPCGCKNEIFIPLGGDGWELRGFDNKTVSLHPSLLNPCGAHYFIKENEVVWCK